MSAAHGLVCIAEYAEGSLRHVGGGVAPANMPGGIEASLPPEVVAVLSGVAVMPAIELVQ